MATQIYILSICIPTFNRIDYLRELLESLLPQAERLNVEVCVSNNYSNDGTAGYLNSLSTSYTCLKFITQPQLISLDENMAAALAIGKGHFLYPLGDDDFIPENTLERILHELESDADLILQNAWVTDAKLIRQAPLLPDTLQGVHFSTPTEAFEKLWDKMPFGSFIASRACFDASIFSNYFNTRHAYAGVVWEALALRFRISGSCKIKCNCEPTVLLRGGIKTWRKDSAIIFLYGVPHWFATLGKLVEYHHSATQFRWQYIHDQTSLNALLQFCLHRQLTRELLQLLSCEHSIATYSKIKLVSQIPPMLASWIYTFFQLPKMLRRKVRSAILKQFLGKRGQA
jgi:glycosyltransferase involved in cell wall biosynthesis